MKKKIQLEKNIIKWITLRPELKHWKLESLQKNSHVNSQRCLRRRTLGRICRKRQNEEAAVRLLPVVFKASQLSALTLHSCEAGLCAEPR